MKINFNILVSSLIAFICFMILSACNQAHKDPSHAVNKNDLLKEGLYSYPHPAQWATTHVEFYAKFKDGIQGSTQDCQRCHSKTDLLGKPKNVSCALECHAPTSTIAGPTPSNTPISVDESQICLTCHTVSINKPLKHYPSAVGLCTTCHTVDPYHFKKDNGSDYVKTIRNNDGCYRCHFRKDDKPVVHQALSRSETSCIECHNAHGSDHRFFVKQKVETLCLFCHTAVANKDHKSVHGIIKSDISAKSCTNCHYPHSGPNANLLIAPADNNLCYKCHDRDIKGKFASGAGRTIPNIKRKVLEGPYPHPGASMMGDNSCSTCHATHASQYTTLLNYNYPEFPYAKYSPGADSKPDSYEACFLCHQSEMLTEQVSNNTSDFRTKFRNDVKDTDGLVTRKNLHWFHVVDATGATDKSQGRSCAICHDPHGSDQEHSIRSSWAMKNGNVVKIEYTATTTGGQCAKTCHETRKYNRVD